jgi:hypothetical protein
LLQPEHLGASYYGHLVRWQKHRYPGAGPGLPFRRPARLLQSDANSSRSIPRFPHAP